MAAGFWQDFGNSMIGNIPKAVLFVRKYTDDPLVYNDQTDEFQQQVETASMQALFSEGGLESTDSVLKTNALTAKLDSQNTALSNLESGLSAADGSFSRMESLAKDNGYVAMKVQYNPSSIYLDTQAGLIERDNSSISNIMNNQITQIKTDALTTLGVQLVFDDMDMNDSFMLDSAMLSASSMIKNTMAAVNYFKDPSKNEHTVRIPCEGLLACLLSPITRGVIFCWSDMIFRGELNQVNITYTMFNKKGEPVRANVDIAIQQSESVAGSGKGSKWNKAFTKVFGQAGLDNAVGGASGFQKATNNALLNLNI